MVHLIPDNISKILSLFLIVYLIYYTVSFRQVCVTGCGRRCYNLPSFLGGKSCQSQKVLKNRIWNQPSMLSKIGEVTVRKCAASRTVYGKLQLNYHRHYQYPINTICENLGLNWGALKKKIDQLSLSLSANANHPVKPQKQPSFVELKLNSQEPAQAPSLLLNHSPRCAIELTKPDGTVMKIFASNDTPLNLLELFKTFLGNSK